jgi:hypothetical protein
VSAPLRVPLALGSLATAVLALVGCRDYDHFSSEPRWDLAGADLAGADLAGADLAGCPPTLDNQPPLPTDGCTTFLPPAILGWLKLDTMMDAEVSDACGALRVRVPGGPSHDFWIDKRGALFLEEPATRAGVMRVRARVHAQLDTPEHFVGIYLRDASDLYAHVRAAVEVDDPGQRLLAAVFRYDATAASPVMSAKEQATPQLDFNFKIERDPAVTSRFSFTFDTHTRALDAALAEQTTIGFVVGNVQPQFAQAPPVEAYLSWIEVCVTP